MSKQDAPKARLSYRYSETLPPLTRGLWCLGTMSPPLEDVRIRFFSSTPARGASQGTVPC